MIPPAIIRKYEADSSIGAASGIGQAAAQRLAADGVRNLALIDITIEHLAAVVDSISTKFPDAQILPIGADCSKEVDIEGAVTKTVERFGRLDVCLNAAGITGQYAKTVDQSVVGLVFHGSMMFPM